MSDRKPWPAWIRHAGGTQRQTEARTWHFMVDFGHAPTLCGAIKGTLGWEFNVWDYPVLLDKFVAKFKVCSRCVAKFRALQGAP